VDGRDQEALYEAFTTSHDGKPLVVVAEIEDAA
jgi:transketolase